MKICVAQTRPVKGNIEQNIISHKELLSIAIEHNAAMIIFPELSITGYEPNLAAGLATQSLPGSSFGTIFCLIFPKLQ